MTPAAIRKRAKPNSSLITSLLPLQLGGSNPCAGQPDGAVVAAGGCSAQFYTCAGGAIVATQQCDSPLVFNPVANPAGCSQ